MNSSINEFNLWALQNKQWVDIYLEHGERQSVMNAILKASGQGSLNWKTVMARFIRHSGLQYGTKIFKVCRGHMAFTDWKDLAEDTPALDSNYCSVCLSPAPQEFSKAGDKFYYLSFRTRLERMLLNENCCRELYGYEKRPQNGIWHDFYDGKCFQRIVDQHGGYSQVKNDVFIAVSTDGFQPFRSTEQDVWPILAIILNLSPAIRYKISNIIPLGFAPGPSPSNLQSYFAPLLHEIREDIGCDGSIFQFYDGVNRLVRVHVVWVLGDLPVVAKLAGVQGHNGRKPCRFCHVTGIWSPPNRHYYYPSKVIQEDGTIIQNFDLSDPPSRTIDEIQSCYEALGQSTGSELQIMQTQTGIKERSLLFSIPTLVPFSSFPIDIMHLLYNVSKEMLQLYVFGFRGDGLISNAQLEFIDFSLSSFGTWIPSTIAPTPSPISKFHKWKAAVHKRFVLNYSLIVFENIVPTVYLNGWEKFVMLYDLVSRKTLTELDLDKIGFLAVDFVKFVEEVIFKYEPNRLSICKYVFHLLLHLKDNIIENGPLVGCSQFWVERYIGYLVARLNAKRLPATALYQASLFNEAAKVVYDTSFATNDGKADGFEFLGAGKVVTLESADPHGQVKRALRYYFSRKYIGLNDEQCWELVNGIEQITSYGRFSLTSEEAEVRFRCCGNRENFSLLELERQQNCYFAAHMNETESEADLYYGRLRNILRVKLDVQQLNGVAENEYIKEQYDLMVADWALNMEIGSHQQIRTNRARSASFTQLSVEDLVVVKRSVSVVENNIPTRFSGRSNPAVLRSRRVSSVIDEKARQDYVLSRNDRNFNGHNILLHRS